MAKGKTSNPADAFRKAQRKKELKKNKAERAKARDFALVKKDTRDVEEEIEKLEGLSERSAKDNARLTELKSELEKINKKKEEWVAEHPEHRKLIFKSRRTREGEKDEGEGKKLELKSRNLFNKKGLPRHPERSIYYDPVMNPYGVAPPGMPYIERPLRPDEIDSEADQEDSDEDIVMPEGPPPGQLDQEEVSDDDIPMPEGPPPPKNGVPTQPPLPPTPASYSVPIPPPPLPMGSVPPPPQGMPLPPGASFPPPPPPPPGFSTTPPFPPTGVPVPPLPPSMPGLPPPPPPPGFPLGFHPQVAPGFVPLPPPGFPQNAMPPPPPGFFPRRGDQAVGSLQDPLSSIPHQTFQAHRAARTVPPHPTLPFKPPLPPAHPSLPSKPSAGISSEAVVSAEPELRDFKKESTAFVPAALKRKKAAGAAGSGKKVNAAPSLESSAEEEQTAEAPRPDLLGTLKSQLGPALKGVQKKEAPVPAPPKPKDDYEKFMEEMGDILGKPS